MASKDAGDISHVEANTGFDTDFDREWRDEKWGRRNLSVTAHDNAMAEKEMTTRQAIHAYSAAMFWSLAISTCVIMEGFDTNLLGNFWAYRMFQQLY
jgi:MFS transporter, SP family, general alpha glucoside:H+ symporter